MTTREEIARGYLHLVLAAETATAALKQAQEAMLAYRKEHEGELTMFPAAPQRKPRVDAGKPRGPRIKAVAAE